MFDEIATKIFWAAFNSYDEYNTFVKVMSDKYDFSNEIASEESLIGTCVENTIEAMVYNVEQGYYTAEEEGQRLTGCVEKSLQANYS